MVTKPKALAEAMGIRKGEIVEWSVEDGMLVLNSE